MVHKVENVVDLESEAILTVEVQGATARDADGIAARFETAVQMVSYTAVERQAAEPDTKTDLK